MNKDTKLDLITFINVHKRNILQEINKAEKDLSTCIWFNKHAMGYTKGKLEISYEALDNLNSIIEYIELFYKEDNNE